MMMRGWMKQQTNKHNYDGAYEWRVRLLEKWIGVKVKN